MIGRSFIVAYLLIGLVCAHSPCATAGEGGMSEAFAGPRVLHFPAERSLGRLLVQDANAVRRIVDFHYWIDGTEWEYLGPAKGDVVVPAGQRLMLSVDNAQAWRDLSPLAKLAGDTFYALSLVGPYGAGAKPGDRCLEHIRSLAGLRVLYLINVNVSIKGLSLVRDLRHLEYLQAPETVDDEGLACVAGLPNLKGLYFKQNRVTDVGLSHLAKLKSLEELDLGGDKMTDAGLRHLAELPRLEYLLLWGRFTDAGIAHLKRLPALRTVNINVKQFSNVGMRYLSECPRLERIGVHWMEDVTDEGLVCLKDMRTLRKLDILHSQVTDEGLVHLAQAETLDYLMLPARITETGLHHLKGLKGLKFLWVSGYGGSPVGDRGLADLTGLQSLEELLIWGNGITDAGVDELVKLGHLRKLILTASSRLTDAGLKKLTALKGLESLSLDGASISIAGLSFLNELSRLSRLDVKDVEQDGSGLDLSGLTRLEDLSLQLKRGRGADRAVSQPWREQDIAALGGLTRLKRLQISHGGATDAALRHLVGLKRLERLSIGGDEVTDDGLACLAALSHLDSLTVSGHFTDRGLEHLQKLPDLAVLDFSKPGAVFSQAAVADFQRNMPRLAIFRGFETNYAPRRTQPVQRAQRR
jgi:Leucine-rich repeat (LRR) protein